MTDKPEIITSGRFELVTDGFGRKYLFLPNKDKGYSERIGPASWSEFYQFAQRIIQHEASTTYPSIKTSFADWPGIGIDDNEP